ncbi:MAG: histidine kinase [Leeuwenhoekiella sp.]
MEDGVGIKSEDLQILVIASSVVLLILLITVIFLFHVFQKRKLKFINERNAAEKRYIEEVARTQLEIQENTLKNVSWELHDNIGQLLSVANMQLNILGKNAADQQGIDDVKDLIIKSLQEVRSLSKSLNNEVIDNLTIIESVENELKRFERVNFLKTQLTVKGEPWDITKNDRLVLFRIVQEFFTNVIKHAKADLLTVNFYFSPETINIDLNDNGIGFDIKTITQNSGLLNIESRAKLIGANLSILSKPKIGTSLKIKYSK